MKLVTVILLALAAVVSSKNIQEEYVFNALAYHTDIGIPLAKKIQAYEENQSRIVGGLPTVLGQIPYQVGLIIDLVSGERSVCGGALISNTKVLTCAHCWWNRIDQGWRTTAVAGSNTLFTGGTRRISAHVVMHGGWSPETNKDNIAMIYYTTVNGIASSGTSIVPIALLSGDELKETFEGLIVTISGYGKISDADEAEANNLRTANVHVISNAECQKTFPNITSDQLCTDGKGNGGSLCKGDGGGPCALIRNGTRKLIALNSLISAQGCELGHPNVYTRLSHYHDWIQKLLATHI